MFLYSIKYYLRSITRRKLFSFINITGLAFSIAFLILIGQFIYYEFNYNNSIKNIDNIYRLVDYDKKDYNIDYRMKEQLLSSIPGIKNACLFGHYELDTDIESSNKLSIIKNIALIDSNFFNVFNVSFIAGNSKNALNSVKNVVLTESSAMQFFGAIDVVGKSLMIDHHHDLIVAGVVKDLPKNLSFDVDIFLSYTYSPVLKVFNRGDGPPNPNRKNKYYFSVFVELNKNSSKDSIEKQISTLHKIDDFLYPKQIILSPFSSDYYNSDYKESDLHHGNADLVKLLSIIGIVVLLLAFINYVNLTTASYSYRLKEFGVKKCLGADRKSLIKQLIAESLFTTLISSILGIILAGIFLPYFNQFIDKQVPLQIFTDLHFLLSFISSILLLSIIIGIIPSLILSKISALQIFKLNPSSKGIGKTYRNLLTMFQFSMATILIAGLIGVSKQIDFVKQKNYGFNVERLLCLQIRRSYQDRVQVFADKMMQYHGVKSLTKTFGGPGFVNNIVNDFCVSIIIDSTSLKTFGFKLIKGRDVMPGDVNKTVIINEIAMKQLKDKNMINEKINGKEIVGVVSDFNYSSLHKNIGPVIMEYSDKWQPNLITIKISGSASEALLYINKSWKEVYHDYPMDLKFYDEHFASMYKKEENLAALVSIFSILAVVISCMGIFGLSVYQTEQRIKEIGIRKVFGASVLEIMTLLTRSFSKWVILSNIIAIPFAYYLMNNWLEDFAYKTELSWWIFVLSGSIALMIALLTISIQAIKAAFANPINAIRYE
jgi:putative ABC transport system permease protein